MNSSTQRVRCPCCGETFTLTPELYVADLAPAQPPASPAPAVSTTHPVPIQIVFDGGSIGNPGPGYGSYQLTVRGKSEQPKRLQFGEGYTNNEAEYDTLIAALEAVLHRAKDPQRVELEIRGDSQLVIKQIKGEWKVKEPRMLERVQRVHGLLQQFGSWKAAWHGRANSIKALGH